MLSRESFTETLHLVAEIAKTQETPLTEEEINSYFKDIELTTEQKTLIYNHLTTIHSADEEDEPIDNIDDTNDEEPNAESDSSDDVEAFLNLPFVKMYLEDIKGLDSLSEDDLDSQYEKLVTGDEASVNIILDNWYIKVVDIAKCYASMNVNMEDVIQEGNIGLFQVISSLLGSNETLDFDNYIEDAVKTSMITFINEFLDEDTLENSIIAKVSLLTEAKIKLSTELNREPSVKELSDYTKLEEDEISDVLSLIREAKN